MTNNRDNVLTFASPAIGDARAIAWLKRVCLIVVSVYLVIGMIALYRALVQVHSLEMQSADVLHRGTAVTAKVVSYARTPLDVRVELVQDGRAEILAVQRVPKNEWAFLDPRTRELSVTAVLTADVLNRFAEGSAILRATTIGRTQLGHLPPPVIREQVVNIRRNRE